MTQQSITREFLLAQPLPLPKGEVDKDARGRVIVVGGHREVAGAALLAGLSALRAGAGKVRIDTVESRAGLLGVAFPEARVCGHEETASGDIAPAAAAAISDAVKERDTLIIGPGMLDDASTGELAAQLLDALDGPTFVLDAAALTGLRQQPHRLKRHAGRIVVTPHAGEMATFLDIDRDAVQADPVAAARRAAAETGAVVIMKGSCTHVVSPQGESWECTLGNVGLATSGSGDTLAGILGALLARGTKPLLAAQWAVYLHAEAGARLAQKHGLLGYLAREIPDEVPRIMAEFAEASRP
ncbi:MAG TPA: NAD(P)H-hydrate dehydratase [Devosia sp.]|jgi:hydroxyethylthiazole kinase-like uncharacterized protein yjeF|uniref:NAD(P)H-hydrate dehydratase n=1 Tax=Devosia sp. TaxID=1871048 RepID=UPI002F942848